VRFALAVSLFLLVACSDPNAPGDPLPLTPQSLEGRWVKIQVVLSTTTGPALADTTEIPQNGEIYEFTESGSVEYSCRCPGSGVAPTPQYTSYSITGDTLWLHQDEGPPQPRLAEVTTRRLIFRSFGATDISGDGVAEDVRIEEVYRRE
jgi:hypothetical protein